MRSVQGCCSLRKSLFTISTSTSWCAWRRIILQQCVRLPVRLPAGQQRQLQMRAFGTGLASGGRMGSNNSDKSDRHLVAVREERFQELVAAEVAYLATVPVKPVSMRQIVTWRNARDMVPTIQKEVPKRFALRIRLIETLDGWQAIPELVKMHDLLTGWYRDLVLLDYKNPDLASFVRSFKSIRDEGRHTIALSASGIYKLRNKLGKFSQQETNFLDEWLDGFLLSRIGTNALIDQFIAIASKEDGGLGRPTGITDPRKKLSGLVQWTCALDSCHWRFLLQRILPQVATRPTFVDSLPKCHLTCATNGLVQSQSTLFKTTRLAELDHKRSLLATLA
ncbi:unnamed protein product [Cladocopium goreaui]|uniref:Protein-serine/threonine kinase n=1 Tax=Cladocopium goreaui TaxID=2562237 RepID=A0A9P1CI88_9DINO|nr:unnamed protein product [Cladocopium goreaui]